MGNGHLVHLREVSAPASCSQCRTRTSSGRCFGCSFCVRLSHSHPSLRPPQLAQSRVFANLEPTFVWPVTRRTDLSFQIVCRSGCSNSLEFYSTHLSKNRASARPGADHRSRRRRGGYAVARSCRRTGAGRRHCSTRSLSSLASWSISPPACEQCQPAPISSNREDRSARKKLVTTNRGSTSRRATLWGTMRRPLARSTASVSRNASTSIFMSSLERARA